MFAAVLRRGALRRVLLAFFIFNAAEWAVWLAVLVYAFTIGGTTTAGVVALLQLIPAALVAPVDKLSVVLVAIFGVTLLGEQLSSKQWIGVVLVGIGAVVLATG